MKQHLADAKRLVQYFASPANLWKKKWGRISKIQNKVIHVVSAEVSRRNGFIATPSSTSAASDIADSKTERIPTKFLVQERLGKELAGKNETLLVARNISPFLASVVRNNHQFIFEMNIALCHNYESNCGGAPNESNAFTVYIRKWHSRFMPEPDLRFDLVFKKSKWTPLVHRSYIIAWSMKEKRWNATRCKVYITQIAQKTKLAKAPSYSAQLVFYSMCSTGAFASLSAIGRAQNNTHHLSQSFALETKKCIVYLSERSFVWWNTSIQSGTRLWVLGERRL